jgi:hypothetical protein
MSSSFNNGDGVQLVVIAGDMLEDNTWVFHMPSIATNATIAGLYSFAPPQRRLLLGHTTSILTGLSIAPCYRDKDRCGWHRQLILITANHNKRVHVSHFPDAHAMWGYLISHALFVSTIDAVAIPSDGIVGIRDSNGSG